MADGTVPIPEGKADAPSRAAPLKTAVAWSRKRLPWVLAAAGLAGAAYLLAPLALGPITPAYRIARGDLTATVVASGRVQTPYRAQIGSQITGVVEAVPVNEGQSVRKDQVLIRLQSDDLKSAVNQAEAEVAQARAHLVQMQQVALPAARMARLQTQAALVNAQLTHDRLKRLLDEDSIARADFDTAQRTLDTARAQDQAADLQIVTDSPGGPDQILAQAQLAAAQAALASARAKLAYAEIRAPVDGVLIARDVERGDVVAPGKALMVLSPAAETQLLINVDEKNLGRLALGQQAVASADAFSDRRFPARVVYINPGVDATTAAVEVKLSAPNPPAYLRQDMTVSVDILSATRRGALIAPADAIRQTPAGQDYVLAVSAGRAVSRPIRAGIRASGQVEILAGLRAGDIVIPSTAKVREGQHLRPHVRA